jgi:hypothetical protein
LLTDWFYLANGWRCYFLRRRPWLRVKEALINSQNHGIQVEPCL